jgi:hypothetical protein
MVRSMVAVMIVIAGGFVAVELSPPRAIAGECGPGYYWSTSHQTCVERPDNSTSDLTAVCRDGSGSHSQSTRGTCSHHGGVAQWCPCAGLPASSTSDMPLPIAAADSNDFVALAVSRFTGRAGGWGTAGSQGSANAIAVSACETSTGDRCVAAAWAYKGCVSVVLDSNSGLFAGAAGVDVAAASANAMGKLNIPTAQVTGSHCSS